MLKQIKKIHLQTLCRQVQFLNSYQKYLNPHILKALQSATTTPSKVQSKVVCEKYFEVLSVKKETEKNKFNMVFSACFQLEQLQLQRNQLCQLIVEGKIKTQSELDNLIKWISKTLKNNNSLQKHEIVAYIESHYQRYKCFQDKINQDCLSQQGKYSFLNSNVNNLCKNYRDMFPEVEGKLIFETVSKSKKQIDKQNLTLKDETAQIKVNRQSNKFWDKIDKIRPRLLKQETNDKGIYQEHLRITNGKTRFRFPPEPNGYLHVGHLKSIRINFQTAWRTGGQCYLRYDDTNPDTQTHEYIEEIQRNVRWMGYTPDKVTFTSDYFQNMLEFAHRLVHQGNAYVCESSQKQIEAERREKRANPFREKSRQFSLKAFPNLSPNQTLRLKLDPSASNPTLRDPIIYRNKQASHPRTGTKYKIYPIYDFAHCISDSLEHIDYSLCSLEFQIRRELYYTILDMLGLYKPLVWQFSRINVKGSVISKRKIKDLIEKNLIESWDDPRLLTIKGMKRRGFTPTMLSNFIDQANASRRGNENFLMYSQLQKQMKKQLAKGKNKIIAVQDPKKIQIKLNKNATESQTQPLRQNEVYHRMLQQSNHVFVEADSLTQQMCGKLVILKYVGVFLVELEKSSIVLQRSPLSVQEAKQKQQTSMHVLSWVSFASFTTEIVQIYDQIITDDSQFNVNSKREMNLTMDKCELQKMVATNQPFLIERVGYFRKDEQSQKIICCALL